MDSRSTVDIAVDSSSRPVVVLIGAGASKAACPFGDRNGKSLPVMSELIDAVGLRPMLEERGIVVDAPDFEAIYGMLAREPANTSLVRTIEEKVFDYFAALELPEKPTVYDYLLVSLRQKDCIITFNWDPLICQAIRRILPRVQPPKVLCLHGNVALAYCCRHEPMMMGCRGRHCRRCGGTLGPERLLYPADKDYNSEPIRTLWTEAQNDIREAIVLTVFGYSAPASDAAAKDLVRSAWDDARLRTPADTDVIDIKAREPASRRQLELQWRPFIHNHYAEFIPDFWSSRIAHSPRRTAEAMVASQLDMEYLADCTLPKDADWDDFWEFYDPIIRREQEL